MQGFSPRLTVEQQALLHPAKAPFFKHGRAQYWLAFKDGEPVGRISAQIDSVQPSEAFGGGGTFGCLDATDDPAIVSALVTGARAWLAEQGMQRLTGPFQLSINSEPGLLVAGHDEPALSMVAWHPPYLEAHLRACGLQPIKDLHYWRLEQPATRLAWLQQRLRATERVRDITFRCLDMKNLSRDVEIIRQVYNRAWQANWGFVPLHPADVSAISGDLRPFVHGDIGVIVERAGKPIGVALIFPNLFEVTRGLGPQPSLIGWLRLGFRTLRRRFRTGHVILLGIDPQTRKSVAGTLIAFGMMERLLTQLARYGDGSGWIEAGWVLEDNWELRKILQQFGFRQVRTLRLFSADTVLGTGDDSFDSRP
ncbi:hypothetical protein [Devosia sp. CAU 1758]